MGTFAKWSKVEVFLQGPDLSANGTPNPFLMSVTVTFSGPDGGTYRVPAFFDGDGGGGSDGNIWKARFSPNREGAWSFISSSGDPLLNGYQGSFTVGPPPADGQIFAKWGRLRYVGKYYLKFVDGPYWIKAGADEPEDFLAPDVMGDWSEKKEAIDYLAGRGVNCIYIMLQNVDGDGENVWPWTGRKDSDRFDVQKLAKWEDLFEHIQSKGMVLHLVLEDDLGWTGFNRPLYYREMIARFAHHNGVIWNISEEYQENYTPAQIKAFAGMVRNLDPYNHPVTVHNEGDPSNWEPFLGDRSFEITSLQTVDSPQNDQAVGWRLRSAEAGWPIVVSFDETGLIGPEDVDLMRKIAWSVYMGGGNFELFTWPISSFQDFEEHWNQLHYARSFMESLPFWQMEPANDLLVGGSGNRYCFRKTGRVYAIYLEKGEPVSLNLSEAPGLFQVRWYDPKTSRVVAGGKVRGGKLAFLGRPPFEGDAAAIVQRLSGG